MVFFSGGALLIGIALWVFCFIDVLFHDEAHIRTLPKLAWVFIVLLFADIGSIAWLVFGHNWNKSSVRPGPARGSIFSRGTASHDVRNRYPEYDSPGRYVPANPDDDEEFLAKLKLRAEEQRRRAEEEKRKNEGNP
ncbi:MAG TPA: PLD nuclease N-terminal domain-containing protein [Jatrophihabitans sp.]|jgi:hypothetical protein